MSTGDAAPLTRAIVDEALDVAPIRLDACAATCPARASGSRRTARGETAAPRPRPASRALTRSADTIVATAMHAMPSPRPIQPMPSFVFPFTLTSSALDAERLRQAERASARDATTSRGFSATIATSTCCTRQPMLARCARRRRAASRSSPGPCSPDRDRRTSRRCRPRAAAPRIASVIACATASPSECPSRCTSLGMGTPPRMSGPGGAKRCES